MEKHFLRKYSTKYGGEDSRTSFHKKSKLSIALDQKVKKKFPFIVLETRL